jgi:peptidoglycan/xylan/chitin deacetylase (PgdA/CDA1 family)
LSTRGRTIAYRLAVGIALLGAVVSGALLAVRGRSNAYGRTTRRVALTGARTIVAPSPDDHSVLEPVATVIPPADAGPPRATWPPALLNPSANLRMAWDLALGRPNAHEILFTFDDGPNPGTTDRLLNLLDRAHYHAVFFVCGWRLETDEPLRSRARGILRDALARGHIIGNHTVHHRNMATLTPEQITYEIDHNAQVIEEVIGQRPHLFRPPYGSYSELVRDHVERRHDELMLWSIDSHDWQMVGDAQGVAMNVIRLIGNMAGGTVLMHDTHPWSVSAAQMVFRWLESENRDRIAAHRQPYTVAEPADYIEGERARIPMITAEREAAAREARHARRNGGGDAGAAAQSENPAEASAGNAAMGSGAP